MADLETSLQSNLIGAGLNPNAPTTTYTDFANTIAKNQQEQQLMEQNIARAKQLAAQSGIQTEQEEQAQAMGVNPLTINVMTPEQAVAYLRIILKEKGLAVDEDTINQWAATLTGPISREAVEAFASRFARETTRSGQPSKFTTDVEIKVPAEKSAADLGLEYDKALNKDDKDTSDGTDTAHVPDDGMYQVLYDNQGNVVKFIPGGKEPADQTAKVDAKMAESTEKQWQKLDAAINTFIKSARGNQITMAIQRSIRAINELANGEVLTPQLLSYIQKDISGIFQGGVPPAAGMEGEDFTTVYQKVNAFIQKYTGIQGYLHTDLGNQRDYLLGLLTRLRESSVGILKAMIASEQAGYAKIINDSPDRWQQMVTDKVAAVESGLTTTAQAAVAAKASPTTVTNIPGVGIPAPSAGKTIPKYTVEE